MTKKQKTGITFGVIGSLIIGVGIGLGLGFGIHNTNNSYKQNITSTSTITPTISITPSNTTYTYYGNNNSNNSILSFSTIFIKNATYQWEYNVGDANTWTNFTNADLSTFKLLQLPTQECLNGFKIRCIMTYNNKTITSNEINISITNLDSLAMSSIIPTISDLSTNYLLNFQNNSNNTIFLNNASLTTSNNLYWNNSPSRNQINQTTTTISFNINNISNLDEITSISLISNNIKQDTLTTLNQTNFMQYLALDNKTNTATLYLPYGVFSSWLTNNEIAQGTSSFSFVINITKNTANYSLHSTNINFYNIQPNITTNNISLALSTYNTTPISFNNNLISLFNNSLTSCVSSFLINTKDSSLQASFTDSASSWTGNASYTYATGSLSINTPYYYAVGVSFSVTLQNTTYHLITYSNISTLNLYSLDLGDYVLPTTQGSASLDALYDPNWTNNGYNGIVPYASTTGSVISFGSQGFDGLHNSTNGIGAYWQLENINDVSFGNAVFSFLSYDSANNMWQTVTNSTWNSYFYYTDNNKSIQNTYYIDQGQTNIYQNGDPISTYVGDFYLNLSQLSASEWNTLNGQMLQITLPYTLNGITSSLKLPALDFYTDTNLITTIVQSPTYDLANNSSSDTFSLNTETILNTISNNNQLGNTYQWQYSINNSTWTNLDDATSNDFILNKTSIPNSLKSGDILYIRCIVTLNFNYMITTYYPDPATYTTNAEAIIIQ